MIISDFKKVFWNYERDCEMKLIPYNKFTIETPYKPEELSRRLESVTTIGTELILYKKATTPFVGKEDLAPYKEIVANVEKMYGDEYGANGKWIEVLTGGCSAKNSLRQGVRCAP